MTLPLFRAALVLSAYFSASAPAAFAQPITEPAAQPRLKGIVHWMGKNRALLEMAGRSGRPITAILQPGERMAGCEVLAIDEKAGRVKFVTWRPRETNELRLVMERGDPGGRTFAFQSARLHQVLEIYQEICGRTVLAPSRLPEAIFDLKSEPNLSAIAATALLDQAFAAKGLFTLPRGAKFVFVLPQRLVNLPAQLPEPPPDDAAPNAEVLPTGMIQFREADCGRVLDIYAELSRRGVLHPTPLRGRAITVRSQTPLTRSESMWLLDGLLLLADVTMTEAGEKFVYAVPSSWSNPLPKFRSDATRARNGDPMNSDRIKFVDADRERVLETYAGLTGREPLPVESDVPSSKFNYWTPQPLTRAEATFALEALVALNSLRFELVGDKQVKLVRATPSLP